MVEGLVNQKSLELSFKTVSDGFNKLWWAEILNLTGVGRRSESVLMNSSASRGVASTGSWCDERWIRELQQSVVQQCGWFLPDLSMPLRVGTIM